MKKKILIISFTIVLIFGLVTIKISDEQDSLADILFEKIESISDTELPEIEILCDTNPYWVGRCWSARYDENNVFLGCEFSGRTDSSCFGDIYKP